MGAAILAGCSLDYGFGPSAERPEAPRLVFRGFTHHVVEGGALIFELVAECAEDYAVSRCTVLSRVSFREFDRSTGGLAIAGRADQAVLYAESGDAELSGNIRIDAWREDALLEAEYLFWDARAKRLESRLDRPVSLRRGDGSWIRGAGFSADARRRAVSFREPTEGVFVVLDASAPVLAADAAADASAVGADGVRP